MVPKWTKVVLPPFIRFSLKTQLAMGCAFLIALIVAVGIAAWLGQHRSMRAVGGFLIDERVAELSVRSNLALLRARRAEKDLLLFHNDRDFQKIKSGYATLVRSNIADVRQYMTEIRQLVSDSQLTDQTRTIEQAVTDYEAAFMRTVNWYGILGNVDEGLVGSIHQKAKDIESILNTYNLDRLMIDFLSLRRIEGDYITQTQDEDATVFLQRTHQFKATLKVKGIPTAIRIKLTSLVDEYLAVFQKYVETYAQINKEEAAYRRIALSVEPILEQFYLNARQSEFAAEDSVQSAAVTTARIIILASIVAVILGWAIASIVSHGITKAVGKCLAFAKRIADGDLTGQLAFKGNNEFSVLAGALNQMTASLDAAYRASEERASALARSNDALQAEVVARTQTEHQLTVVARARAVMAKCNHVLVHATAEPDLLKAMCETVVEVGNYRMAWIGYAQQDEAKSIISVAHAGFEKGYLDQLGLSWGEKEETMGIAGAVIVTGKPVVVRDIHRDPRFAPWRKEALERGYSSAIGLPLRGADGLVFGNLSIYSVGLDAFNEAEVELLTELANDIAYGICSLRSLEARRKAEESLRLRHRAIESSVNAIVVTKITRGENPIEYVNPAFERITGYSADEVIGRDSHFLLGDSDQVEAYEIQLAMREQRECHIVIRNYRKNGSFFWNDLHIAPVRDDNGVATHFVGVFNDITEAKDYQQQLEHHANFDTLTGLANRNLAQDRLRQAVALANRQCYMVAVIFLDLDQFKFINDSMGHDAGDKLLKAVAARLATCVRDSDTVARLGGDEFVIICSALRQTEDACVAAQKALSAFHSPFEVNGRMLSVTASIGVSVYPQDGDNSDLLLKNADAAMYRSKDQGRDRFQFYTRELGVQLQERVEMENGLRRAVSQDEFELHYQPKVTLKSGLVTGVEALIRWRHPMLGMISPVRSIPLAEETGLIVPIGEWALRTACLQIKEWHAAGHVQMTMSVNLSARQFRQCDMPDLVRRVLAETGVNPRHLDLELTESVLMQDTEHVIEALRQLKIIGVSLSLDDFGTGYSSLSYLKRFPIDVVKIDRSFIKDVTSNVDDATLTRAIIAIARSLNMKTVAEGVETEAQLGFLRANGCDAMQGYLFSRPLPPDEFTALLSKGTHLPVRESNPEFSARGVLLVDDDADDMTLLSYALRNEGYRIFTAASANEALELLAIHPIGVVISDARMPNMSGGEFLRRVKRLHPNVVRMLISGTTELRLYTKAVNEGAVYKILIKPCDEKALREDIAEAFLRFERAADDLSTFTSLASVTN